MTRFYTNSENAHNLTKVSKKNKFYFRTLTRSNIEQVYCETDEAGMEYIKTIGYAIQKDTISIDVIEQYGQKYITIYEVVGVEKGTDKHVTMDNYLGKAGAEEYKNFCYRVHSKNYDVFYIREHTVWCE